jgi:hypothetical protein
MTNAVTAFTMKVKGEARDDFRWCPSCGVTSYKLPMGNNTWMCRCGHIIRGKNERNDASKDEHQKDAGLVGQGS